MVMRWKGKTICDISPELPGLQRRGKARQGRAVGPARPVAEQTSDASLARRLEENWSRDLNV